MSFLMNLIYWETLLILFALLATVVGQLFSGGINTQGLLLGRTGNGNTYFSPERVQLLLITLAAAFQYVIAVLHKPTTFPEVSGTWLALLGSSHAVYLGGKFGAAFLTRRNSSN